MTTYEIACRAPGCGAVYEHEREDAPTVCGACGSTYPLVREAAKRPVKQITADIRNMLQPISDLIAAHESGLEPSELKNDAHAGLDRILTLLQELDEC